ncbi:MAG: hypothetical protein RR101_14630 [Burkholderiaceae bacterium]
MANDWLRAEIATGLQKLLALRLAGTPPEDAIGLTAAVWLEAITGTAIAWDESLDRNRVRRSFLTLTSTCDRWPAPRAFLINLPQRPAPIALPLPSVPAAVRRANLDKLKAATAGLKRISSPKDVTA